MNVHDSSLPAPAWSQTQFSVSIGFCPETRIFAYQAPDFIRYSPRRLIGPQSFTPLATATTRSPRCHLRYATPARDKMSGRFQSKITREKQATSAEPAILVAESTPPLERPLLLSPLTLTGFALFSSYRKSKCNGVRPVCKTCQDSGHDVRERLRSPHIFLY